MVLWRCQWIYWVVPQCTRKKGLFQGSVPVFCTSVPRNCLISRGRIVRRGAFSHIICIYQNFIAVEVALQPSREQRYIIRTYVILCPAGCRNRKPQELKTGSLQEEMFFSSCDIEYFNGVALAHNIGSFQLFTERKSAKIRLLRTVQWNWGQVIERLWNDCFQLR